MAAERISVSLDRALVERFEAWCRDHGYGNRSEAIRDLIRERLEADETEDPASSCVGTLTYIYNHEERELARRLTRAHHHHHDVAVSTLHVHLDHDHCLETVVVRGRVAEVRAFADAVIAEPGVRHGKLQLVPVAAEEHAHAHSGDHPHPHSHLTPKV